MLTIRSGFGARIGWPCPPPARRACFTNHLPLAPGRSNPEQARGSNDDRRRIPLTPPKSGCFSRARLLNGRRPPDTRAPQETDQPKDCERLTRAFEGLDLTAFIDYESAVDTPAVECAAGTWGKSDWFITEWSFRVVQSVKISVIARLITIHGFKCSNPIRRIWGIFLRV